jgi:hypothetical protein
MEKNEKKTNYCMKDLMVNMMDFEVNISMMENILVMVHVLNNQVMMENNLFFIKKIINLIK